MRLTLKLSALLGALSVGVLAICLVLIYEAERRHLHAQWEQQQLWGLDKMVRVCEDSFIDDNELSRLAYLRTFWASSASSLDYVVLIDEEGRALMHSDFLRRDPALYRRSAAEFSREAEELRRRALDDPVLQEAKGRPALLRRYSAKGKKRLWVISRPVEAQGRRATLAIAYDRDAVDRYVRGLQRESFWRYIQAAGLGLVLSLAFSLLLARALVRPLRELRMGAVKVGEGDFAYHIIERGEDELGDLAREFNRMGGKLAELEALKDGFLAKITHDLRNPLAAIIGYAELLSMGTVGSINQAQRKILDTICSSGDHLNELVNNILDLTKLEAGRMEFIPRSIMLAQLAGGVCELLRVKAGEYGVSLDSSDVPADAQVWADEEGLNRVLVNLTANALKFTPSGGKVCLGWRRAPSGEDEVWVSDTGVGIPKEKLPSLFTRFFQVAETQDKVRPSGGTGLGLAICKEIVEAHGGRIWAESAYGKGTTFRFTLPPRPSGCLPDSSTDAKPV